VESAVPDTVQVESLGDLVGAHSIEKILRICVAECQQPAADIPDDWDYDETDKVEGRRGGWVVRRESPACWQR
jgi:hypothetical protein